MSNLREAAMAVVHAWDTDGPVSTMEALRSALAQPEPSSDPHDKQPIDRGTIDCWRINYGLDKRTPAQAAQWWSEKLNGLAPSGCVAALGVALDELDALRAAQPEPAAPLCRTDGRCQYAIDHGAEGLGHCPKDKCAMPEAAPTVAEPVAWMQTENFIDSEGLWDERKTFNCEGDGTPLYLATPPRAALTVDEAIHALSSALSESKGWLRDYSDAVIRDAIDRREPRAALSDAELACLYIKHARCQEEGPITSGWFDFARAVEAAHGIGETK